MEVIVSVHDLERHEMLQLAEERFEQGKEEIERGKGEIEHGKQLLKVAEMWFNEDGTKKPEHPRYKDEVANP